MPIQSRVFSGLERQNGIIDGLWRLAISFWLFKKDSKILVINEQRNLHYRLQLRHAYGF